jgi:hypothetical protein
MRKLVVLLLLVADVARAEPPSFAGSPTRIRRVFSTMLCNNLILLDATKRDLATKWKEAPPGCAKPQGKIQCLQFVDEVRAIETLVEHGKATIASVRQTIRERGGKPIACTEKLMAATLDCYRDEKRCDEPGVQAAVDDFKEAAALEASATGGE